jgi:ribosomal-protein-serine acetyltransferase
VEISFPAEMLLGPRLVLRRHTLELAPKMFALVDGDRGYLREYLPWVDLLRNVGDEENYIRLSAVNWMEGKAFDYGLYLSESDSYLGNISAHTIHWKNACASIGYWISSASQKKGYMTEALFLLEAELFRLGFHRLEIRCNQRNAPSAGLPKRSGYTLEGILREDVLENGVRRNTMIWSKLCNEPAPRISSPAASPNR